MKRVLVLGGAYAQIPIIKKAKEMGHYIITCDYLVNNPGHQYAHEYYNVSILDKDAVLNLARDLEIDGILAYESDKAAMTAAYVAEKLGLPTHPYESVKILSKKDSFRKFQKRNNFKVPKSIGYSTLEAAIADFNKFKKPVMIKPVDSSGSRGISKIDSIDLLPEKVEKALSYSMDKRFVMEEYINKDGFHISGDGFSVDGQLVFRSFADTYFLPSKLNPFIPKSSTWPCTLKESIQNKIHDELQRVLKLLNMQTGAIDFDIQIDEKENVYIIEIGARNGGGWLPNVIHYATGVDMIEYTIKAALGENCSDITMQETKGFWANSIIPSNRIGKFNEVRISEELIENIVEYEIFIEPGAYISATTGGHEIIGLMILNFTSLEEMHTKIANINKYVEVIVDEN